MATPTISDPPGTVYIGRIPHGFYEHQMREYFSQFGTINRLRLSRNRRTGASKHYAFIEFESAEVADIVARAMDKYLLFGHILQVRVIPQDQLHPDIWKGAGRRFKKIPWAKLQGKRLRDPQTRELWRRRINREEERRKAKADKLKDLGYDFEMPDLKQVSDVPAPQSTTEKPLAIDSISATEPITVAALLEDKQQDSVPSTTKITSKRRKTKAKAT